MFRITKELFKPVADGPVDVILFDELWPDGAEITVENFEIAVDHELGECFMKLLIVGSPAYKRWHKSVDQTIDEAVAALNEEYPDGICGAGWKRN